MQFGSGSVKTDDFDYYLPEELIAQTPLEKRDSSRLLVLDKQTGEIEHKHFTDIINYLNEGDTLVLNDTKVMPARIIGEKKDTKAVIELLLLKNIDCILVTFDVLNDNKLIDCNFEQLLNIAFMFVTFFV